MNDKLMVTVEGENINTIKTECNVIIACCANRDDDKNISPKANMLMIGQMSNANIMSIITNMSFNAIRVASKGDKMMHLALLTALSGNVSEEMLKVVKQMGERTHYGEYENQD